MSRLRIRVVLAGEAVVLLVLCSSAAVRLLPILLLLLVAALEMCQAFYEIGKGSALQWSLL